MAMASSCFRILTLLLKWKKWKIQLGGQIVFSHGTSNSRGVVTLFPQNINFNIQEKYPWSMFTPITNIIFYLQLKLWWPLNVSNVPHYNCSDNVYPPLPELFSSLVLKVHLKHKLLLSHTDTLPQTVCYSVNIVIYNWFQ